VRYYLFLKILFLWALGLVFPGAAGAQYLLGEEPVSVEASSRAGFPGHFSGRLLAGAGDYRVLFLSLKDYEKPERDFTTAGFQAPWLNAGPLTPGGLFREVFSPLGYTAGSSVFAETTRLSLNTAEERSSREGLWISVPGDYLALGAYTDGEDITHTSAACNFFRGKEGPLLSGLFMVSEPPGRLSSEDWFPEKPLFPGGKLYHTAFRGQIPFDGLSGGLTRAGLSGAFSFGERAVSSGYYHLFASHRDKKIDLRLLQGTAGKDYVNPSGRYPSYRVNRSISVKLFPRGTIIPYAAAAQTVYQVYRPTAAERPKRLQLSGGAEYRTKRLSLKLEGARKTEKDSLARETRSQSMGASFLYKTGVLRYSAEYSSGWENAIMTRRRLSLGAGWFPEGWEFSARLKGEWKPGLKLSGKLSAALDRPGLKLGVSAELAKPVAPWAGSVRSLREAPWDYLTVEAFLRYAIKF
jgi:hypothetical protein